jgi:hypothetical protein
MLDLSSLPTSAVVRLTKATPKREGAGIVWDIDFSMEVPDEVSAQAVDAYLPGAASAYAARKGSQGTASTSGGFDMMRVCVSRTDGTVLASCHAEVRKCSIKVTSSQGVLTVSLRLHGLVQDAAMDLAYQLDEQVEVELQSHSSQLSLIQPQSAPKQPDPSFKFQENMIGKLVVHRFDEDSVIAGIISSVLGDMSIEVATLEDEELVAIDFATEPDSIIKITAPKGEYMHSMLREYVERCDANRCPASWTHIVSAIGVTYAAGRQASEEGWMVDRVVLEKALSIAATESVPFAVHGEH